MSRENSIPFIRASLRGYGPEVARHSHGYGQMLFAVRGNLDLEVDGRCARVDTSTGLYMPPGSVHAFESRRGAHCVVVDAYTFAIDKLPRLRGVSALHVSSALQSWASKLPTASIALSAQVAQRLAAELAGARRTRRRREASIADVYAYVDRHMHREVTTAELARHCGLGVSQLHARFAELLDQPLQRHLRRRRLDQARRLLSEQSMTVASVAHRFGYRSPSAFTAALQREYGVSARELWRRR